MATLIRRLAALASLFSACANAQDCPPPRCFEKPVTVVVPFAAGGSVDRVARLWADELSKALSQAVVVDNKGGAAGALGMQSVARSAPDSHTILLSNQGPITITPQLVQNLPVDPLRDLVPSAQVAVSPQAVVVSAESPIRDLASLLKKRDGAKYGTGGSGTLGHLLGRQLADSPGTQLTHIPYRGSAQAMTDVLAGQLDAVILDLGSVDLKSGKYRALAVSGQQRAASAPDVPTFVELGFRGLDSGWIGAFFPAGTPGSIVSRINTETQKILRSPEFRSALASSGLEPGTLNTAAFASLVREDSAKWSQIVRRYDIKLN